MRDGDAHTEHALIAEIYDSACSGLFAEFRSNAMRRLMAILPFDGGVWGSGMRDTNDMLAVTLVDVPPRVLTDYAHRWQEQDFVRAAAVSSPGRAFRNEDCMPLGEYHRSGIYQQYSKPNGIEHALGIVQPIPTTPMGDLFFLFRGDADRPFTDRECSLLERLSLHLGAAAQQAQLVQALRFASEGEEVSGEHQDCALLDTSGLLLAIGAGLAAVLKQQVPDWIGPRLPHHLAALVSQSSRASERIAWGDIQLLSIASGEHRLVALARSQPKLGLTPAELRAARLYVGGATQRQIASDLGISANTVRNQIASTYVKLGVHSKLALAQRLGG